MPKPNEANIKLKEMPRKKVAAITFGGWADDERIEKYRLKLVSLLDKEDIKHSNKYYFLGYNPPFELLNRKNELIIEIDSE